MAQEVLAETQPKKAALVITFNGEDRELAYQPHEQVEALLNRALNAFGIKDNRHLMSLFTEGGAELDNHSSVADAGVKNGDVLVLRQSAVKGGS